MAVLMRLALRSIASSLERQAQAVRAQISVISMPAITNVQNKFNWVYNGGGTRTLVCGAAGGSAVYGQRRGDTGAGRRRAERDAADRDSDSDSGSDSDTECKGLDRSEFWRRKMRTVHNILDVDKDGLVSYNDFLLFAERFKALGHLDKRQADDFTNIIKMTWEEQWGAVDPYNLVSVEQYLEDMRHVLADRALRKKAARWLPYLFRAVDADRSGHISVREFRIFYECLGLSRDHAAVAFAVIDTNHDGKVSLKEFVRLGRDYFLTEDESRPSRMFWGPLQDL